MKMSDILKKIFLMVISALSGMLLWMATVGKARNKEIENLTNMSEKHLALFLMMNQWVNIKREGKHIGSYFERNGYKKIAVYGMSFAGKTLLDELEKTDICVAYAIDKNADRIYADTDVITMEDEFREVDAIVVTAITFFDEIKERLVDKVNCPILSLEDILYEV